MQERKDRVNWSTLKAILVSPRHYRVGLDVPRTDTPAMLLGRLVHCMILEPERVADRYCVMPRYHGGMNDATAIAKGYEGGKQARQAWVEEHTTHEHVPADTWATAVAMCAWTPTLYLAGGENEADIEWTDHDTGIQCRGRIDHIGPDRIVDLKTTRNIEPHAFGRDAARMLYHAQLAWYHDGCERGRDCFLTKLPAIVAIENDSPYDCAVYEMTEAQMDAGCKAYRKALELLSDCRHRNEWPGVAPVPTELLLPNWATTETETETTITMGGVPI